MGCETGDTGCGDTRYRIPDAKIWDTRGGRERNDTNKEDVERPSRI